MNSNIVLTSKLVTINQGQYIVKVKAKQEHKTIGSALACAYSVEEAEDKARERVLQLVNPIAISCPPLSDLTPSPPVTPKPESKPSTTPPTVIPKAKQEKPVTPSPHPIAPQESTIPTAEVTPPRNEEISQEETLADNIELPLSYEEEKEETPPPTSVSNTFDLSDAVDFSQVIDQTSIELKRLGWTQEQGKKYLLETYGKKSRHLLSDQELIEFLTYLQTQ
ncbi:hypothetical protein Cyast_0248 [Cyanobacterium stanieri PCC 7202]|uniref:Uncharacterized protein n=1 Tax=Cyanobacterium stanieri (strain ATCC 29140 / PCC 7202) TaxID=292563 RepID=K9YHC0_CYASC|nr:hypothetical protein Cyast_0248 [Cyanobacterium stanieri PCC 7202]